MIEDLGLAGSACSWAAAHAPGSCSGGGALPGSRSGSFLAVFNCNQTVSTKHLHEPAHSNGEMSCLNVSDQLSCGGFLTFPPGCVSEGKKHFKGTALAWDAVGVTVLSQPRSRLFLWGLMRQKNPYQCWATRGALTGHERDMRWFSQESNNPTSPSCSEA